MGAMETMKEFLSTKPDIEKNMTLYNPDQEVVGGIGPLLEDIEVKLFTANWCPDCRIQLPRFFSVISTLGDPDFGLEIFEVDRSKMDELGMAEGLGVMAIPTFIFFKNGEEMGRIIERPKGRMEEDILEILRSN
jgi:thiol-disulfide isomerase/thioredoxin